MQSKKIGFVGWILRLWLPVGFLLLTLSVILWAPLIMLAGALGASPKFMKYLVKSWVQLVPCYFFIGNKVYRHPRFQQEYPVNEPLIVVSNHQSLLDIPAAYYALPGNLRMLAKDSLFRIPFFGWALRASGNVEIVRGNRASGRAAIEAIRKKLSAGIQVWVAPEGTRSAQGWQLGTFKAGAFSLALDLGYPIQPIVVLNAYDVLGKGSPLPRIGATIETQVLPLVDPKKLGITDKAQLSQYVWEQMNAALESYWKR